MGRLLSMDQGFDLLQMFLSFPASDDDVFARTPKVVPAAIEGERPQNHVGKLTGMFCHLHLRAVEAAQDGVQHVAGGEVVEITINKRAKSVGFLSPPSLALAFEFEACSEI